MAIEFELKYAISEDCLEAVYREHTGLWEKRTMETSYYDTPTGDLRARGCALRIRMENGTPVSTVKTPGRDGERGEWEVEEADIMAAVSKLCQLGAPEDLLQLTRAGIIPVCGARFTRLACSVRVADTEVELALDQGILFSGDAQIPLCELEVELKSGCRETAVAFAQELTQKYGLRLEPKSKFQRAMELKEER